MCVFIMYIFEFKGRCTNMRHETRKLGISGRKASVSMGRGGKCCRWKDQQDSEPTLL